MRVHPRAGSNTIDLIDGLRLRVHVTAPPERGKANKAAIGLLADRLGVPKGSIEIVRGQRSRDKVVEIKGLRVRDVADRLGAKGI